MLESMESIKSTIRIPRVEEYVALVHERLPAKTAAHTMSVAEFIASIAQEVGITKQHAVTAGLLHDICKDFRKRELLAAAENYGIDITPTQKSSPHLLHGPVAAEESRLRFDIDDETYEAIYWHTTGKPGLCKTGLALYLADYAEPLRSHPEAAVAVDILHAKGFIEALDYASDCKLTHVRSKSAIDPMTESFHEWLHNQIRQQ